MKHNWSNLKAVPSHDSHQCRTYHTITQRFLTYSLGFLPVILIFILLYQCLAKVVIHSLSYLDRNHTNLNKTKNPISLIFKTFKIYYLNKYLFFSISHTVDKNHWQLLYEMVQY